MSRRLLWIHQNFVSARQAGNSRPVHILAALAEAGWDVDVVTGQCGYLDDARALPAPAVVVEREGAIALHRLDVPGQGVSIAARRRAYREFFGRAQSYVRRIDDVDLVFCSTPPPQQVLLSILESARRRVPMVLEVRDLWPAFIAEAGVVRARAAIAMMAWIEALSYRAAARVIPVAPAYARHAANMGAAAVTVVPTGGDPRLARVDGTGNGWKRDRGLEGRLVVLYAGSFNEYYGFPAALAAAAATPEIVWVFAGNGRARDLIEAASQRMRNVIYAGSMPRDDLDSLYAAADAALVLMGPCDLLHTMLPGKLFDAMAAGLPVLSTARGSAGAIIRAAGVGVVTAAATGAALATAARELAAQSEDERRRTGYAGREWVLRHMHAHAMARRVVDVINDAMSSPPRRALLFAAGAAALNDVIRRRSQRSIDAWYRDRLEDTVAEGMAAWPAGAATPPLRIPQLLTRHGNPPAGPIATP